MFGDHCANVTCKRSVPSEQKSNLFVQQKYIVLSMYKLLLTYIIFRVLIYGRVYTVYCIYCEMD